MKQKKLVMTFYDADGNVVDVLSKDPARPDDVIAALQFLDVDCEISVAVREFEIPSNVK